MTISQILYFVTVGKYDNITKASEELHISQPAITKSIKMLEEELGVVLLRHNKNCISLTYEGKIFLLKAQDVLFHFKALEEEIRDYGKFRRNVVKIGVPPAIGTLLLPKLNIVIKEDLGINLEIFEDSSPATIHKVENGDLDLAFVLLRNQPYPGLDKKVILRTSLDFCTNRSNRYGSCRKIGRDTLKQIFERENIILFFPGVLIKRLQDSFGVKPKYLFHSNQVLTIQKYLHYGIASTFQFPQVFRNDPAIVSIPLEPNVPQFLALVRRSGGGNCRAVCEVFSYVDRNMEQFRRLFVQAEEAPAPRACLSSADIGCCFGR